MTRCHLIPALALLAIASGHNSQAQSVATDIPQGEVRLQLQSGSGKVHSKRVAVVWLQPLGTTAAAKFAPHGPYVLLQKNRMFYPHAQVIPVGAVVQFPNADPFFHNVFSLYDGKRFDLGLYEAGSSKAVTFSREGISYIFCNIHPEMSAVIVSLSTSLYAMTESDGPLIIDHVPYGDYRLNVWFEGVSPSTLRTLARNVHVEKSTNLGRIEVPISMPDQHDHLNKFGAPYGKKSESPY